MATAPLPVSNLQTRRRARFVALPAPLIDELLQLGGDRLKVALRLLQRAAWEATEVDGIRLDAGECLISQRSEKLWGDIRFDRAVDGAGLRSFIRRTIDWLVEHGYASVRPAHRSGPGTGPLATVDRGPSPTIVRFLKYREILWPEAAPSTHPETGEPAHPSTQAIGPIEPRELPAHLEAAASGSEVGSTGRDAQAAPSATAAVTPEVDPIAYPLVRAFQAGLAPHLGARRVRTTTDPVQWAAMDAELRRVGVQASVAACVERAARRRAGMNAIGSLWWFLPSLRELPDETETPRAQADVIAEAIAAAKESCPEWGATLQLLAERINYDVVARWIVPLEARLLAGNVLELTAPTPFAATFIEDQFRSVIEAAATVHLGSRYELRLQAGTDE
jgi:hypothetical protein